MYRHLPSLAWILELKGVRNTWADGWRHTGDGGCRVYMGGCRGYAGAEGWRMPKWSGQPWSLGVGPMGPACIGPSPSWCGRGAPGTGSNEPERIQLAFGPIALYGIHNIISPFESTCATSHNLFIYLSIYGQIHNCVFYSMAFGNVWQHAK
jgi:hypothetical protein